LFLRLVGGNENSLSGVGAPAVAYIIVVIVKRYGYIQLLQDVNKRRMAIRQLPQRNNGLWATGRKFEKLVTRRALVRSGEIGTIHSGYIGKRAINTTASKAI
jgi:hypothetical protein